MHVQVSGKVTEVNPDTTIADFLAQKGLRPEVVAVEYNREIAPRERWREIVLTPADQLQVVSFVGGS